VPASGKQGIARVAVDDTNMYLIVSFLAETPQPSYLFKPSSYSLTGGQRFFPRILKAAPYQPASPPAPASSPPMQGTPAVLLTLDQAGDFSIYTLTVSGPDIDPFFSSAKLRFRLACDESFDCAAATTPPAPQAELPVLIDYLSKDYASFRQALLDFIPTRLPAWIERNEADLGMVLLELFAYTADNLSYMQDRVATEAFLGTATQRRSVAGHLALIGYQMDEGASAHTWLRFTVSGTSSPPSPGQTVQAGFAVSNSLITANEPLIVFETLVAANVFPEHNQMFLYDWGNSNCCLPQAALSAALAGRIEGLQAGDYLAFDSGNGNCDIVQLTAAPSVIAIPVSTEITVVEWSAATPLTSDHCVAATTVLGNLIPATHGQTVFTQDTAGNPIQGEILRSYAEQQTVEILAEVAARPPGQRIPRQRLTLSQAPLAHLDPETVALGSVPAAGSATANGSFTDRPVRSISTLQVLVDNVQWTQEQTLLNSQPGDQVYRVEIDDNGLGTIVFGDGTFGQRPSETSQVIAQYRVGGGAAGNIGADTLTQPISDGTGWLISVTNLVPAIGGRDLESRDHARRMAPPMFHDPLVAVTVADYQNAAVSLTDANGNALVQRANANFQWTGSWLTVRLAVDPLGTEGLTAALNQTLLDYLGTRRLAGYDVVVAGPAYAPVELAMEFTVAAGSEVSSVETALLLALSNGVLPGGAKGFFHPDNFTFGDSLYVSRIYAAVMATPGVQSAEITLLAQQYAAAPSKDTAANLARGYLAVGANQIIRLDNDRNFPQNGTLSLTLEGASA